MRILFSNLWLLDPEAGAPARGELLVEDGRIAEVWSDATAPTSIRDADSIRRIDLAEAQLAPGFLDLHFHGELIFASGADLDDALRRASAARLRHGTTGFLATTVCASKTSTLDFVERCGRVMTRLEGARCLGVHLEGPWINAALAGAQPVENTREYEASEGSALLDAGLVRMLTLAPELPGALAAVEHFAAAGCVVALGHSAAMTQQIDAAVERGMTHVTHLFNAMTRLHHRELGTAGCALTDDRLGCDLICDGVHVHPRMIALAARAKGEQLCLITDRVEPPSGADSDFGAGPVRSDGTALRLADGRLAGSELELDRAVANFRRFTGASLLEAVAAVSLRPARVLGVEHECGTLRVGARADFAVLTGEGEVLETWIGGRRVFERAAQGSQLS